MKEKLVLYLLFIVGMAITVDWILEDTFKENFVNSDIFFPEPIDVSKFYTKEHHEVDWNNVNERQKFPIKQTTLYNVNENGNNYKFDASKFSLDITPYDCDEVKCCPFTIIKPVEE